MPQHYLQSPPTQMQQQHIIYQPQAQTSVFRYDFSPSPVSSDDLELAPESPVNVSIHLPPASSPFCLETPGSSRTTTRGRSSPSHIPRPRNAFMIFRSEHCAQSKINRSVEHDHRHISRIVGHLWNKLPEHKKEIYRQKAEREKFEHTMKYPNYRFAPGTRERKPIKRKVKRNGSSDLLRCEKVAELIMEGVQGDDLEVALQGDGHAGPPPPRPIAAPKRKRTTRAQQYRQTTPSDTSSTCSSPSIRGWTPRDGAESEHVEVNLPFMSPLLPPAEPSMDASWSDTLQYPASNSPSPSPPPIPVPYHQHGYDQVLQSNSGVQVQTWSAPIQAQAQTQTQYAYPSISYAQPNLQNTMASGYYAQPQQQQQEYYGNYEQQQQYSMPYDAAVAQGQPMFTYPWSNRNAQSPVYAAVDPLDTSVVNWGNPGHPGMYLA